MDATTCGQGLAAHSAVPAKLAELIVAMGDNLEAHLESLDLTDEDATLERDAYVKLVERHRRIAAELKATADEMAGYRDLPMGRHDDEKLASPTTVEAFESLVRVEQELITLLEHTLEQHRSMR